MKCFSIKILCLEKGIVIIYKTIDKGDKSSLLIDAHACGMKEAAFKATRTRAALRSASHV